MQDTKPSRNEFEAQLERDRFDEIKVVERPPNGFVDTHAHPWEAKALVLSGEITIDCGDGGRRYGPGDIFHVACGTPHAERFGPEGVSFVAGRKYRVSKET
jgi:quercetin dioxygenase-like cupin family protein